MGLTLQSAEKLSTNYQVHHSQINKVSRMKTFHKHLTMDGMRVVLNCTGQKGMLSVVIFMWSVFNTSASDNLKPIAWSTFRLAYPTTAYFQWGLLKNDTYILLTQWMKKIWKESFWGKKTFQPYPLGLGTIHFSKNPDCLYCLVRIHRA